MEIIKPSKKDVFNSLRASGCCWLGGRGCECISRQLGSCFADEEKRLTKTVYTEDEIKQIQSECKEAWEEEDQMFRELFCEGGTAV